ncbi:hypothetical protein CspeluHIS016_0212120 [Cutaneotrichosporon spelunceum]|uniref:Uncharacterized protein n=1 Tax=Cutaneotrichosporon spelunceum TaxID=1672016 RepID=A0AAD3TSJ3_9TREE|nr:hypothetical protein CspeluHIS016_0212120 [Cutaneotrichosporon spelunceum]
MPIKRPNSPSSAESSPRVRRRNTQDTHQATHPLATPAIVTPPSSTPPSVRPDPSPPSPTHHSGSHRGTPAPGSEAWRKTSPPPSRFPRCDWHSATWAPPNLATEHVTPEVFQLAGKFASVAVQQALDGDASWSDVGASGIHLALVDLMLQCRDHLRSETRKRTVLHYCEKQPHRGYLPYDNWLRACEEEMERIYTLAQTVVPAAAFGDITLADAKRYCTAAILSTFGLYADALTRPPRPLPTVPASFLGQYDATPEQLERYGMCLVGGSISLDTDEGQILRSVAAALKRSGKSGGDERKRGRGATGLRGMPLPTPVHIPVGPIAGTSSFVKPLPTRRR